MAILYNYYIFLEAITIFGIICLSISVVHSDYKIQECKDNYIIKQCKQQNVHWGYSSIVCRVRAHFFHIHIIEN